MPCESVSYRLHDAMNAKLARYAGAACPTSSEEYSEIFISPSGQFQPEGVRLGTVLENAGPITG